MDEFIYEIRDCLVIITFPPSAVEFTTDDIHEIMERLADGIVSAGTIDYDIRTRSFSFFASEGYFEQYEVTNVIQEYFNETKRLFLPIPIVSVGHLGPPRRN